MDRKKIELYYKGRLIAQDITKIMYDEAPRELKDYTAFSEWVKSNVHSQRVINSFSDPKKMSTDFLRYSDDRNMEHDILHFADSIRKITQRERARRKIITRLSIALSVASVVVVSFLLSPKIMSPKIETRPVQKEVAEGPILITDGVCINLTALNRELIINNDTIASLKENTLSSAASTTAISKSFTIVVPKQCSYRVTFTDGTSVSMNANSKLTYKNEYGGKTREVSLSGEAFFDVAKSDKPFIVTTKSATIKVYGTRFNVNTHCKGVVRTSLVSGSVGVRSNNSNGSEMMVKPNQTCVFDINSGAMTLETFNADRYSARSEGYFRSDAEPLSLLLDDLANWYQVEFNYEAKKIEGINVDAWYSRELSLEKVLNSLEILLNIEFIKNGENKYELR